jgi:hypothetical protein
MRHHDAVQHGDAARTLRRPPAACGCARGIRPAAPRCDGVPFSLSRITAALAASPVWHARQERVENETISSPPGVRQQRLTKQTGALQRQPNCRCVTFAMNQSPISRGGMP